MAILSLHGTELTPVTATNLSSYTPICRKTDTTLVKLANASSPNNPTDIFYDYYLNVHKFMFLVTYDSVVPQIVVAMPVPIMHNSNIEVVSGREAIEMTNDLKLRLNIQPTTTFSDGVLNISYFKRYTNSVSTGSTDVVLYDKTNTRFEIPLYLEDNVEYVIEGFFAFLPATT